MGRPQAPSKQLFCGSSAAQFRRRRSSTGSKTTRRHGFMPPCCFRGRKPSRLRRFPRRGPPRRRPASSKPHHAASRRAAGIAVSRPAAPIPGLSIAPNPRAFCEPLGRSSRGGRAQMAQGAPRLRHPFVGWSESAPIRRWNGRWGKKEKGKLARSVDALSCRSCLRRR